MTLEASQPPPPSSQAGDPPALKQAMLDLLQAVYARTGLDFRDYAESSLRRRVQRRIDAEGTETVEALHALVERSPEALQELVQSLTVPVTSMFRDPAFFHAFRDKAVPMLRTHPFLRLWIAGCATGEEAYSLAILLHETGLLERSRIYATELQPEVLSQASAGVYPLTAMREYTKSYLDAGGQADFSEYYTADATAAIVRPFLRKNLVFATHNLVSDRSFNEFHVIFCRNVMIYFNRSLQERVHDLLYESLAMWGYLGLGRSESVRFSRREPCYEPIVAAARLYRKIQ